MGTQPG